mgnify:CR=1 FL=1
MDECGECGGPGAIYECGCYDIPEGDCDCDGNTQEDNCGECEGDNECLDSTSYIYSENQYVLRGSIVEVPLYLHPGFDEIDGITFAVDISAIGSFENILEDINIATLVDGSGSLINQTGEGQASVVLYDLGSIIGDDVIVANLLIPIPNSPENSNTYSLNFNAVSGSTVAYEYVEMQEYLNVELTVITLPPVFEGIEDVYLLENISESLDFIVFDPDGNTDIDLELIEAPDYVTLNFDSESNDATIHFNPGDGEDSNIVVITATNSEEVPESTTISFNIQVYETYLAGDVRPWGDDLNSDGDMDDAGEFGDDIVGAPDVINTLKVATAFPEVYIPDSSSNLYNAFDVNPLDLDLNGDGDYYDENERGGDGNIDATDVIVSLNRSTMVAGFENIRRSDILYPYSTAPDTNRDEFAGTDTLILENIESPPGQLVQVPVLLKRSEGDPLIGLVSGFAISWTDGAPTPENLTFVRSVNGSDLVIQGGENYLSVLIMVMEPVVANSEIQVGVIEFVIPFESMLGDVYSITSNATSGASSNYDPIVFSAGNTATVSTVMMEYYTVANAGNNLLSFNVLPTDLTLTNVVSEFEDNVSQIIGQGVAAINNGDGNWMGSLLTIEPEDGYWIDFYEEGVAMVAGYPLNPDMVYNIDCGWDGGCVSLLSYAPNQVAEISEAIPDDVEEYFEYIISAGVSAIQTENGEWVGSLESFNGARGYWFNTDEALTFQYNLETLDVLSRQNSVWTNTVENIFSFSQSEVQSFYFIDLEEIEIARHGDWILAFHNEVLVGSRQWMGKHIDVPIMGFDGNWNTVGYPQMGDHIDIKFYSEFQQTKYLFTGNFGPLFQNH